MSEKKFLLPAKDFFSFSAIFFEIKNTDNTFDLNINGYDLTSPGIAKAHDNPFSIENFTFQNNPKEIEQKKIIKAKKTNVYERYFSEKYNKDTHKKVEKFLTVIHNIDPDNFKKSHNLYHAAELQKMMIFAELSYYYGHYANNVNTELENKKCDNQQHKYSAYHKSEITSDIEYLKNLSSIITNLDNATKNPKYERFEFPPLGDSWGFESSLENMLTKIESLKNSLEAVKRSDKTTAERKLISRLGNLLFKHRDPNDINGEYNDLKKLQCRAFIITITTDILNIHLEKNSYQEALDNLKKNLKTNYKKEPNEPEGLEYLSHNEGEYLDDFE